jgi:hypothetical protein
MIYIKVWQPKGYPIIGIKLSTRNPDEFLTGYVAAIKSVDPETGQPAPAYVRPNISYQGDFTPDAARETTELWHCAASTAETLDKMILSKDDLNRPIKARMVVKTVTLEWND